MKSIIGPLWILGVLVYGVIARSSQQTIMATATSAPVKAKSVQQTTTGTVTPAPVKAKSVQQTTTGTVTAAPVKAKSVQQTTTATVTSAPVKAKSVQQTTTATVTSAPVKAKSVQQSTTATVTSALVKAKSVQQTTTGTVTPAPVKAMSNQQTIMATGTTRHRRQFEIADDDAKAFTTLLPEDQKNQGIHGHATRFTMPTTTTRRYIRTTLSRISFAEDCDYLAQYCMKAYDTGIVCGRTLYYRYYTFKNYCLLDYVNCMERYEVWQVVHMGECFEITPLSEYIIYPYHDDFFLDQYYIVEDN